MERPNRTSPSPKTSTQSNAADLNREAVRITVISMNFIGVALGWAIYGLQTL